ncbi:MAG: hypothetical protein [Bacteriophage sp.]|nr:MAG: hypothetical protein [Bacteriophage sp.]
MSLNGFVPNGFAFNGKLYPTGVTPIDGGKYGSFSSDVGFSKVFSDGLKPNPIIPNSIFDLVAPGIYSTKLNNLNDMDGFLWFMNGCFSDNYDVPVLIFVPDTRFKYIDDNTGINKHLLLLHYSQFHEKKGDLYDRDAVYNALSGNFIPELSIADMQHLSYVIGSNNTDIGDITKNDIADIISNKLTVKVKYDDRYIEFYSTVPTSYVQLYVGGYGFKAYYPQDYILLAYSGYNYKYILIKSYEQLFTTTIGGVACYKRNYKFTSTTNNKTIGFHTPDPYVPTTDNNIVPYTYEHQSNILVSLDVPYNPEIYTIIGEKPFEEKIELSSQFRTLDNIGVGHVAGKVSSTTWASHIRNYSDVDDCLPLGEYILSDKNSLTNAPVSNGMYTLNVFSAGNGSMIQQVLTDPGVAQYNKYTRSWSVTNGAYGSWSGTYQI